MSTRIVAVAKREEDGRRLVDLECTYANGAGEGKILGEAIVDLTAR